jgi:hypothetical protein
MAMADQPSNIAEWPPEGLPLKETAIRMGGAALFEAWRAARIACPTTARRLAGIRLRNLTNDEKRRIAAADQSWHACFSALLTAWNAGELMCMGRRGDPLATPTLIPPPVVGWTFRIANLERSIVFDPAKAGTRIFDLRFWPNGIAPVAETSPVAIGDTVAAQESPLAADVSPSGKSAAQQSVIDAAKEIYPNGYSNLGPGVIIDGVGKKLKDKGLPVPKRDVFLRALGFRK